MHHVFGYVTFDPAILPRVKTGIERAKGALHTMIVLGRHRPLAHDTWNELAVRAAIEEIAADAIADFRADTFWPGHPGDDGVGDGNTSFYFGAAGVIWALDYLQRIGAARVAEDFRPVLPRLLVLRPKRLIPGEGRKRLEKTQHQQRLG